MVVPVAERYLLLGLRLGRHVEGLVDAYVGPTELAAAVAVEPLTDPAVLVTDTDALLADLEDGWLRDQGCSRRRTRGSTSSCRAAGRCGNATSAGRRRCASPRRRSARRSRP